MMPVMLDVSEKKCVIIGGGTAALRKAKTLLENGADVTVISENLNSDFEGSGVKYMKKSYSPSDISGCFLAVAATDSAELNRQIGKDSKKNGTLFLAADGGRSDLAFMAYTKSDRVKIAVSTGGAYPLLGAKICRRLQSLCKKCGELCAVLPEYRKRILNSSLTGEEKRELLEALISDEALEEANIENLKNRSERIIGERL